MKEPSNAGGTLYRYIVITKLAVILNGSGQTAT
jgi:hypothetical protein